MFRVIIIYIISYIVRLVSKRHAPCASASSLHLAPALQGAFAPRVRLNNYDLDAGEEAFLLQCTSLVSIVLEYETLDKLI